MTLKFLWLATFLVGTGNLILFVLDGELVGILAAVACLVACVAMYKNTWRKQ